MTSLNILNASLCNEELTDEERYELIREQTMLLSRMEWLIATLLKISKLDAGTITLKPQAVYLKDVVEKQFVLWRVRQNKNADNHASDSGRIKTIS